MNNKPNLPTHSNRNTVLFVANNKHKWGQGRPLLDASTISHNHRGGATYHHIQYKQTGVFHLLAQWIIIV